MITHGHCRRVHGRALAWLLARLREVHPSFDDWGHVDGAYDVLEPTHLFARRAMEEHGG